MSDFVLIFRQPMGPAETRPSMEQMQAAIKPWQDWMGSVAAQNKLVSPGSRLNSEGRVVRPGKKVTNGPFVEIKEGIGGYIVVRAKDFDEAVDISMECPILNPPWNGTVDVRKAVATDDNS